ncbi:hypothetical protein Tco_0479514 [Tanacetum coccineum]
MASSGSSNIIILRKEVEGEGHGEEKYSLDTPAKLTQAKLSKHSGDADLSKDMSGLESSLELRRSCYDDKIKVGTSYELLKKKWSALRYVKKEMKKNVVSKKGLEHHRKTLLLLMLGYQRTSSGAKTDIMRPQVHHGGSGAVAMDKGQEADKGMFMKEYLVETVKRGQKIFKVNPQEVVELTLARLHYENCSAGELELYSV